MAFRRSMGLRNKLLSGTQGFKQLMDGGQMRFYSGSQPVSPEYPESGVLLATIGTGGLTWGTAASGRIDKNGSPWDGTCSVAGVAGWFRFYGPDMFTGTDGAGTAVRFDGAIGSVSGDIILSPTSLAVNAPIVIDSLAVNLSMSSS